jgi:hypothetical protein
MGEKGDKGEKPAKVIKELRGVVSGEIQTPPEPLITVDAILDAKDKVARSAAGSTLTVIEVGKRNDGCYRLQLQLGAPPTRLGANGGQVAGVTIVNNRAIGEVEEAIEAPPTNFALVDSHGKAWKIKTMASHEVRNTGRYTQEYDLIFEAADGAGEPARLVYRGWRLAVVDVPFVIKDVPIP